MARTVDSMPTLGTIRAKVSATVDSFIPPTLNDPLLPEGRRARMLTRLNLLVGCITLSYGLIHIVEGNPAMVGLNGVVLALSGGSLWCLRMLRSVSIAANLIMAAAFFGLAASTLLGQGAAKPLLGWLMIVPMLAMTLAGLRSGLLWLAVTLAWCGVLIWIEQHPIASIEPFAIVAGPLFEFTSWAGAIIVAFGVVAMHEADKNFLLKHQVRANTEGEHGS